MGSVCQTVSPLGLVARGGLALALASVYNWQGNYAEGSDDRPSDIGVVRVRVWDLRDGHIREMTPGRDPRRDRTLACPVGPAVAAKSQSLVSKGLPCTCFGMP